MSARIFISHSAADGQLGAEIGQLLEALIVGAEIGFSSLPGHEPAGGQDTLAAMKQGLANSDVVVGLITAGASASSEVPFQLGAAWALGKPLQLLLGPDGNPGELYLPMGHAEALVLGPEALLELASSIAASTESETETGQAARDAFARLYPDWHGLDRESSERAIEGAERESGETPQRESGDTQQIWPITAGDEPAPTAADSQAVPKSNGAQRAGLPSCAASLQAGRAVSECVFNREEGGRFADELDMPFGVFLASLGGNWSVLRELEDLDVWIEAAENVLGGLAPAEDHVRRWYEVGFRLAPLVSLATRDLDGSAPQEELDALWQEASGLFQQAAREAAVAEGSLEELLAMLDNLRGPQNARDYANLGRVQERMRELAGTFDHGVVAVSA
jgi:hypothetical protein